MQYAFTSAEHGTFTPDGRVDMTSDETKAHNAALEALELSEWNKRPERFAAYVTDKGITTWLGTVLGTIATRSTRHRNNLGARIECITVRGNNGATYHGRYGCDWSQLVRLRKSRA